MVVASDEEACSVEGYAGNVNLTLHIEGLLHVVNGYFGCMVGRFHYQPSTLVHIDARG